MDSRVAARGLLGHDIVVATLDGPKTARIMKTRSFNGVGKNEASRKDFEQPGGNLFLLKLRHVTLLNITTGRQGDASCVWIEEAKDPETGKMLRNGELIEFLGLGDFHGKPVFSKKTAIVPGPEQPAVESLDLKRASNNTTGIFQAFYPKQSGEASG